MTARADAAAETGRRIVEAAYGLFERVELEELTLEAVAERAGVTVQTVLRRFGSKEGLMEAVAEAKGPEVGRSRAVERPGDVSAAVGILFDSYERIGDLNWRMLRQEHRFAALQKILAGARRMHRDWIEAAFAPLLPARGRARDRVILTLFAATDFYQWKLLRWDLGLSRVEAERLVVDTVKAIAKERT